MIDETERAQLAARATQLANAAGLPAIADTDALVNKLNASGVSIHFHAHLDDDTVIAKLRTLANDGALFVQDVPLNGPGPKLPAGFVTYLGGLAPDFAKMPASKRLGLWSDWCAKTGTTSARTINPLAPKIVAPIPCPSGSAYNPELERLETRLRNLDARPTPQGFQARQQHQRSREFIQSKIDRIASVRRRTAA